MENCSDTNTIVDLVDEHLSIGAATVNVFKLLGVHEQGKLLDVTGNGTPISGGDGPGYTASNAYNKLCGTWRSSQRGDEVTSHSYIGYDFGPIVDDRTATTYYGADTFNHKRIATMRIQQGRESRNRVTRARVERSMDGIIWYGASIAVLPDDGDLHQISLRGSAASRYWRIRPLAFNGGPADFWEVNRLELHELEETQLSNVQYDGGFLENRDRDYAETSIPVKMYYELFDAPTELSKFGIEMDSQQLQMTISFKHAVQHLGRPLVIGDIIELPSEKQYTSNLSEVLKYMEITDVMWSSDGYTPGWTPTTQRVVAVPMIASQETMDVIKHSNRPDSTGFVEIDDSQLVDLSQYTDRITADINAAVPQRGKDVHGLRHFDEVEVERAANVGINMSQLNQGQRSLYVENGLPPNNEPYTEGDAWPSTPSDGDWHRLTYNSTDSTIPPRLFKFNKTKGKWIYYETDRRTQYDALKPSINEALTSQTRINSNEVGK